MNTSLREQSSPLPVPRRIDGLAQLDVALEIAGRIFVVSSLDSDGTVASEGMLALAE